MIKLYSSLAPIYHEMYQQIFDYDKEFRFYHSILQKHHCHKIIEIGCGTGLLSKRLIGAGYDYLGVDLYPEMLVIAKKETNSERFLRQDMRNLELEDSFDCALITGRSIAYVISDQDIKSTFNGINRILKDQGILAFDSFDAKKIFGNFVEESEQVVETGNRKITRKNFLKKNLETCWTWDFKAKYIIEENGEKVEYNDFSTLRAFTEDEIRLFLKITGFEILDLVNENVVKVIASKTG